MNAHRGSILADGQPAFSLAGRPPFDIRVERHGRRSFLAAQFVTYPFHVTRPFQLDRDVPEVATLYMQSSSGGLYADEDLRLAVHVGRGAALHLTTQGSTIVHGHDGRAARMRIEASVEEGGFFAYTPDPQILFPGAAADTGIRVDLAADAAVFLCDGFFLHDPDARGAAPVSLRSTIEVRRGGRPLFVDRQRVAGADLAAPDGPLAGRAVSGSVVAVGFAPSLTDDGLETAICHPRALSGATGLPENCGSGARILADDGAAFQAATAGAFQAAFTARFGVPPATRRK